MGELILCSRPLAAFPYFLEDAGINIYSLEELCYYIEKNMYLLDERMMDEALCGWLETELAMPKTAGMLREIRSRKGSVAEFVSCLLRQADYFAPQKQRRWYSACRSLRILRRRSGKSCALTAMRQRGARCGQSVNITVCCAIRRSPRVPLPEVYGIISAARMPLYFGFPGRRTALGGLMNAAAIGNR